MILFSWGDFMIAHMSKNISSFFIAQGIISDEDREVYEYSFEILLSTLLSFIALAVISILSNSVIYTVLYLIGFIPLRMIAGGYHAKTHLRCFILLMLTYSLFLVIISQMPINYSVFVIVPCVIFSIISVLLFAPSVDKNRPISSGDIHKLKKRSRYIIIGYTILIAMLIVFPVDIKLSTSVALGNVTVATSLLANQIKTKITA